MSEQENNEKKENKEIKRTIIGCDIGTGNLVVCKHKNEKSMEIKTMRNMFFPISPNEIDLNEMSESNLNYIELLNDDKVVEFFYIVGSDALKLCNLFGKEVMRPMAKGVLNSGNIDAVDIITKMVESLTGTAKNGYCVYSIPAMAIDVDMPPVLFHEKMFQKIFTTLGYESTPLNESMAIIYSECADTKFTGLAISFGSGLTNVALSYRGVPVFTFSVGRGGDWIDENAANSTGMTIGRVTNIKEKKLDLNDLLNSNCQNRKEKKTLEALNFFYNDLIEYVIKKIVEEIEKHSDELDMDDEIPIIVSGGTSLVPGFVDTFKENFNKVKNFPYNISEIRSAKDPLSAVAVGCMIKSLHNLKN